MATAAQRALGVPELAEAILINVDTKTLLFAQRVCTAWRQIIQESKSLQQALFFQPTAVGNIKYLGFGVGSRGKWHDKVTKKTARNILGNPFARRTFVLPSKHQWSKSQWLDEVKRHRKWLRPEASFRKMLICQPAAENVVVCTSTFLDLRQRHVFKEALIDVAASGEGVTLGDVFDTLVNKHAQSRPAEIRTGVLEGTEYNSSWTWVDQRRWGRLVRLPGDLLMSSDDSSDDSD